MASRKTSKTTPKKAAGGGTVGKGRGGLKITLQPRDSSGNGLGDGGVTQAAGIKNPKSLEEDTLKSFPAVLAWYEHNDGQVAALGNAGLPLGPQIQALTDGTFANLAGVLGDVFPAMAAEVAKGLVDDKVTLEDAQRQMIERSALVKVLEDDWLALASYPEWVDYHGQVLTNLERVYSGGDAKELLGVDPDDLAVLEHALAEDTVIRAAVPIVARALGVARVVTTQTVGLARGFTEDHAVQVAALVAVTLDEPAASTKLAELLSVTDEGIIGLLRQVRDQVDPAKSAAPQDRQRTMQDLAGLRISKRERLAHFVARATKVYHEGRKQGVLPDDDGLADVISRSMETTYEWGTSGAGANTLDEFKAEVQKYVGKKTAVKTVVVTLGGIARKLDTRQKWPADAGGDDTGDDEEPGGNEPETAMQAGDAGGSRRSGAGGGGRPMPTCYYCGEEDHQINDCKNKKKDEAEGTTKRMCEKHAKWLARRERNGGGRGDGGGRGRRGDRGGRNRYRDRARRSRSRSRSRSSDDTYSSEERESKKELRRRLKRAEAKINSKNEQIRKAKKKARAALAESTKRRDGGRAKDDGSAAAESESASEDSYDSLSSEESWHVPKDRKKSSKASRDRK